jgi:cytochrome c
MIIKHFAPFLLMLILFSGCSHETETGKDENLIEDNRFSKMTIVEGLLEPYELAISKDNKVFFIQRNGEIQLYNPANSQISGVGKIPVHTGFEDGLMGITLDPDFLDNHWVYLFYSPLGDVAEFRLSRFEFNGDSVLRSSEKIILHVPTQREDCCHTGGSITFDSKGNLFLSVGDNTTPFKSNGYAPLDERPGTISRDDQRTTANSKDLRGKILRITPQKNGTYTIPDGNLFPKDGSIGRPEIYVMGNRNPFRISVDYKTGWLYWGEIGPDAGEDSERGPKGHDEINQARKPGNFGWPYFIADNKPYAMYDFSTDIAGPKQDPMKPINNSVNNTGTKTLPPAQKAFIYYPYAESKEFPIVGTGGRSAMAGPIFHYDMYKKTPVSFPKGLDKVFFAYDWMRGWILAVRTKPNGDLDTIENHFTHLKLSNPMDVEMAPDGSMYVLEYGYKWFSNDKFTKLSRIIYDHGNRTPIPKITVQDSIGPNQFKVHFSSEQTVDPDKDKLTYEWKFTGHDVQSRDPNPVFTFVKPGVYYPALTVKDKGGKSATVTTKIVVGNHEPEIQIMVSDNSTFYWEDQPVEYRVTGEDREDGKIKDSQIQLSFKYLNEGEDLAILGHQMKKAEDENVINHPLINKSDCKACHQLKDKSVGPSFFDIAIRYKNDKDAIDKLTAKIIKGGAGSWGNHAMSAHPQISLDNGKEIVRYILSVIGDKKPEEILQTQGTLKFTEHLTKGGFGKYYFTASYTDKGIGNLTGYKMLKLRNPRLTLDESEFKGNCHVWEDHQVVEPRTEGSYWGYKDIDFTDISSMVFQHTATVETATMEVRLDSLKGQFLSTAPLFSSDEWYHWKATTFNFSEISGKHNVYFILHPGNGKPTKTSLLFGKYVYFNSKNAKPVPVVLEKK